MTLSSKLYPCARRASVDDVPSVLEQAPYWLMDRRCVQMSSVSLKKQLRGSVACLSPHHYSTLVVGRGSAWSNGYPWVVLALPGRDVYAVSTRPPRALLERRLARRRAHRSVAPEPLLHIPMAVPPGAAVTDWAPAEVAMGLRHSFGVGTWTQRGIKASFKTRDSSHPHTDGPDTPLTQNSTSHHVRRPLSAVAVCAWGHACLPSAGHASAGPQQDTEPYTQ
jgi:hypothetical protein